MSRAAIAHVLGARLPTGFRDEDGFTLIELLAAMVVLSIGVVGILTTFDTSRGLATRAEMRDVMSAEARGEIQRIEALPWASIALASNPTPNPGATAADPTHYLSSGPCGNSSNPPATSPCYQWDWTNSASVEPLVVSSSTTDTTPEPNPWSDVISTRNSQTRVAGDIYRYITWANDPECTSTACGGVDSYKRITVAVTLCKAGTSGAGCPTSSWTSRPVVMSTLFVNPAGGTSSPLTQAGVDCLDGTATVPCTH